jgi:hypothetical protein
MMPTHRKRPRDPAQLAKLMIDIAKILVCCTRDWEAILTYRAVIIRYP